MFKIKKLVKPIDRLLYRSYKICNATGDEELGDLDAYSDDELELLREFERMLDDGANIEKTAKEFGKRLQDLDSIECTCGGLKLKVPHHYKWCDMYKTWKAKNGKKA